MENAVTEIEAECGFVVVVQFVCCGVRGSYDSSVKSCWKCLNSVLITEVVPESNGKMCSIIRCDRGEAS